MPALTLPMLRHATGADVPEGEWVDVPDSARAYDEWVKGWFRFAPQENGPLAALNAWSAALRYVETLLAEPAPDHTLCPLRVQSSLQGYVRGLPTGDFLRAVLSNDLAEAIARADDVNLPALPHIVAYVREHLPAISWGSPAAVNRWLHKDNYEMRAKAARSRIDAEPYGPSETQMQARIASVSEEPPSSEVVDLMGALKDSLGQRKKES